MSPNQKSAQQRLDEMITIYKQIESFGINERVCSGIKEFKIIANMFVKNAIGSSGKIDLPEIDRYLLYTLSLQSRVTSNVVLKPKRY